MASHFRLFALPVTAILLATLCAPAAMAEEPEAEDEVMYRIVSSHTRIHGRDSMAYQSDVPVTIYTEEEVQTTQEMAACGELVNAEPARYIQTGSRIARPANSSNVRVYSREELQLAQAGGAAAMAEPVCR